MLITMEDHFGYGIQKKWGEMKRQLPFYFLFQTQHIMVVYAYSQLLHICKNNNNNICEIMHHGKPYASISINAVKRLIAIYLLYIYINTHTYSIYFENISMHFHVYIYINLIDV